MGRIKSAIVKRTSFKLFRDAIAFSPSFEENKKFLKNTMPSKKVKNQIAGFLARIVKRNKPILSEIMPTTNKQ